MTILASVAGGVLIALVILDICTVLFRPGAEGKLSRWITRGIWVALAGEGTIATPRRSRRLRIAGPLALACAVTGWALVLITGWALIYLPHYPHDFSTPGHLSAFVGSLSVSLSSLTTLGSASAVPHAGWLSLLIPLEALSGLALLTAAVAYLLQLAPVLARRRSLAYEINLLSRAREQIGLHNGASAADASAARLSELTSAIAAVQRDLVKFPIAYYFAESDQRFALAGVLPYASELASRGASSTNPVSVRLPALMLEQAVDDLAATIAQRSHSDGVLSAERADAEPLPSGERPHALTAPGGGVRAKS